MPHVTVHYGPPGSDRNQELFDACLNRYERRRTVFLYVVVTRVRRQQLQKAFLNRFSQVFEFPVLTFPELVRETLKGKEIDRQIIGEAEKRRLIEGILRQSDFAMARDPQNTTGLLPFVSQYIGFLKRQNVSDEKMLRLQYQKFEKELAPLEEELVVIFSRYQHLLQKHQSEDREGLSCLLYESLLTGTLRLDSVFPGLQRIVLEGFCSFAPIERGIVQILANEIDETHFSIDLDSPQRKLNRFSEVSQGLVDFLENLQADWIFYDRKDPPPPTSFLRSATREDEVQEVARQITRLRAEHDDLDLADIAIVCSDPDDYKAYVHETFPEFAIPFRWFPGRLLAESQAVSAFLKYLRVLEHDFRREELFDLLSSAWIHISGLSSDEIHLMDRLSIQAGIVGGLKQWASVFRSWVAQYVEELRDRYGCDKEKQKEADWIERSCSLFLASLESLSLQSDRSLGSTRSFQEWAQLLTGRLQPFFGAAPALQDKDLPWSRLENLSLARFLEELKSFSAFCNTGSLTFQRFSDLILREVSQVLVQEGLEEAAVMVGDKRDFQQCRFRFLFWIGFAEGKIPDYPHQHIFFDDTRSSQWGFRNWKTNRAENYSLFHVLRYGATESIHYGCSKRVSETPILPSPLLRYLELQPNHPVSPSPLEPTLLIQEERTENIRRGIRVQGLRERLELSVFDGVFSSTEIRSLLQQGFFAQGIKLSPTQLEEYVQCGFRYFTRRVLRVEPPSEIEPEWTALERGGVLHRILFRFMAEGFSPVTRAGATAQLKQEWAKRQRRRMAAIVRQELSQIRFQDLFWKHQERKLLNGLEDETQGLLARFIELEGERSKRFSVHSLESHLGPLRLGDRPLRLHGVVDRIDREGDGYFLLDYKTGSQDYRKRVFEGWGFQLPLHVLAAMETLPGEIRGAGFYHLRLPLEVEIKELPFEERVALERLVNYYRDKALQAATQLYKGHFPVTLLRETDAGCRTCGYRDICRIDPARMQQVKLSGQFLADETILERGRWVKTDNGRD